MGATQLKIGFSSLKTAQSRSRRWSLGHGRTGEYFAINVEVEQNFSHQEMKLTHFQFFNTLELQGAMRLFF